MQISVSLFYFKLLFVEIIYKLGTCMCNSILDLIYVQKSKKMQICTCNNSNTFLQCSCCNNNNAAILIVNQSYIVKKEKKNV